jgi:hypothetical protein
MPEIVPAEMSGIQAFATDRSPHAARKMARAVSSRVPCAKNSMLLNIDVYAETRDNGMHVRPAEKSIVRYIAVVMLCHPNVTSSFPYFFSLTAQGAERTDDKTTTTLYFRTRYLSRKEECFCS